MPQPPSPTTTIFLEKAGPSVLAVPADSLPEEVVLIIVLTVPSLDLVPRVSRRCESGLLEALLSCLSCKYVELR